MLDTQKSKQLITTSKRATALLPFCVNENRQFLMTQNIKLFYELLFSCVGGGSPYFSILWVFNCNYPSGGEGSLRAYHVQVERMHVYIIAGRGASTKSLPTKRMIELCW